MKAAFFKNPGAPSVIEWGEMPMPTMNDDEVLVKVSAVTVNPIDTYYRSGKYQANPPLPKPFIVGKDMVGTVSKTGANVTEFKQGQRVWCNSLGKDGKQGSFAEYVSVNQDLLFHAPENVDDIEIASVIFPACTAALGLVRDAQLKSTDTLYVNGGGGSIAGAVIQIANARGARVITSTKGKEKMVWCKSIGADVVYDYSTDNIEEMMKKEVPKGVDVYWDTSRNPNFDFACALMAKKGRIILMAGSGSRPPFPVGLFYNKECTLKGLTILSATTQELRQCADVVNLCLEQNLLKSKIQKVLPLSEAAQAHAMMEAQPEGWGKIVLTAC